MWQERLRRLRRRSDKEEPLSSCEDNGSFLVVDCSSFTNAHPEVMRKWSEKIHAGG